MLGGGAQLFSLDPTVAYLNHGAFGAVPLPVQRAQRQWRDRVEAEPTRFFANGLADRLGQARIEIARFVGADPARTALLPNVTAGTATVLGSLTFAPGDEILMTEHGYGSVALSVARTCRRTGAVARTVEISLEADDEEAVAAVAAAIRPGRTRLVIVDQITSPTAKLLPVAAIARVVRDLGAPVLVDAAHAPGMLPLDVDAIGADFWVGNLHKWAFAPRPTAALVVAAEHCEAIEPLVVSWEQSTGFPLAVEFGGTLDYTAWLAAPDALKLLTELGTDEVRQHNADLARYGQQTVAAALGLDPATLPVPTRGPDPVSMRVVPLPGITITDPAQGWALRDLISERLGTAVAVNPWRGRALMRLCAQIYNSEEQYDRLASALAALLAEPRGG